MTLRIHLVAGARPNFMKIAPLYHVLEAQSWAEPIIVHTGQHHDRLMSDVFLQELNMPAPRINLGAGSGTHAEVTAAVMLAYEKLCHSEPPDWVVVVGDVNSTLAAALVAKKIPLPLVHLEAGLRSFDRTMPEEINRILTDAIADLLWTPSEDADANLKREGIAAERIVLTGNVMIDAYEMLAPKIRASKARQNFGLAAKTYGVVTLHRPTNVDDQNTLDGIMREIRKLSSELPLVFPVHPRTRKALGMHRADDRILLVDPLGYIDFMSIVENAALVVTDSGGVQEETSYLGIPCLTVRATTERPITLTLGTNRLVRRDQIAAAGLEALKSAYPARPTIPLWDGYAAHRMAQSLKERARGGRVRQPVT
jgi:UDP-N-acetylglucosamine 2-epimerase (non-hydrolysing)